MSSKMLRNMPSVAELLDSPALRPVVQRLTRNVVVDRVRTFLDDLRSDVSSATGDGKLPDIGELAERIARRILQAEEPLLRPVINATGTLLHPELGGAPLADAAVEAMSSVAGEYASLEMDLTSGRRSQRMLSVESLLKTLTGAEAALVVNSHAGATLLALSALARNREVLVSRGELAELSCGCRLADAMLASGARLREVGTTNRTHLRDYEEAIQAETAALVRVQPSNYVVMGCAASVALEDLVRLAHRHQLTVIDDVGFGALTDLSACGIHNERFARESIAAGADLVLVSGDKLLGGPQCGILVGRRALIEILVAHPLSRAVQVDKLTLAALSATLKLHRDPQRACSSIPLLQLLGTPLENLKNRAERLAPQLAAAAAVASAEPVADTAFLGGGSVPLQRLDTWCIALVPAEGSVDRLSAALRTGSPSVVGRIQQDRLLLDLRSLPARHDQHLVAAVEALGASDPAPKT